MSIPLHIEVNEQPERESSPVIPIAGKVIESVIASFCQRPIDGDDSGEFCSVGVAENSIIASDGRSAVIIGESSTSGHHATKRKEALLEARRADLYADIVNTNNIDRNVTMDGEIRPMRDVQSVVFQSLSGMDHIGELSPDALAAIAKVAKATGAVSVNLYTPKDKSVGRVGFEFSYFAAPELVSLFNPWDGPIKVRGVFVVNRAQAAQSVVTEEEASIEAKPAPKKKSAKKAAEIPVDETIEEQTVEVARFEPDYPDDISNERGGYFLPKLGLLEAPRVSDVEAGEHATDIVRAFKEFGIDVVIEKVHAGPSVELYEVRTPPRVKTAAISGLRDNLQMSLGVTSLLMQVPIPGRKAVGIQVPKKSARVVQLRELVQRRAFIEGDARLSFAVGLDVSGKPVYGDLAKMPHLLIAGATNSGKSIGLATLLTSLLLRNSPKDLRLVMIDPKRVELTLFDRIPHLMCPVIKDVKEAPGVLRAVWREMDRRYDLFSESGVRNIDGWNEKASFQDRMPYIVVVIDELADLMIQAKAEVETTIVRLAQMARAVGIHMVVATQRPSVDIVTGLIKANIPSRIAFSVASQVDSRVIIDRPGAETLIGKGDMLYSPIDASEPRRVQGCYVSEAEVEAICRAWRDQGEPEYINVEIDEEDETR